MASPPLHVLPTLADDLARVEQRLTESVQTDHELLTEVARHLISAGGKRVRPGFVITSAATGHNGTCPPASEDVLMGGVAVELVHMGSLYHDDVMDGAKTRRNVESVNARWGNIRAILAGDFLLAKASEIAASLGTEVAGLLATTIGKLCEGEVRELQHAYDVDRTEASYLLSIQGKTASLLAASCRIGGIVGRLDPADVDRLTDFGHAYGMAFQIVDDILDVVSTDGELGKPVGNDLVEGVYTLPVIRALASPLGPELREVLGGPLSPDDRDRARALVRAAGGIDSALKDARTYADDAARSLDGIADNAAGRALRAAADHLIARVSEPIA